MSRSSGSWTAFRALRLGLLLTLLGLCVWRVGFYTPQPGVNHEAIHQHGME